MPDKSTMNDPQNVWQNQSTEAFKMSVDQLKTAAHQLERKSRFEALYSLIVCTILLVFFARLTLNPRLMLGPIPWGAASLWSVRLGCALICIGGAYEAYKAYKRIRSPRRSSEVTLETTLRSYRTRLEDRRNRFRNYWHYKGLWIILTGMALAVAPRLIGSYHQGPQYLLEAAPLAALFVLWLIAVAVVRRRVQRKLQQEIDQLRAFEREYQV